MDHDEYELEFAHYIEEEKEKEPPQKQGTGLVGRAFFQLIWFGLSGAAAYFATQYLISESVINLRDFYRAGVPETVPEPVLLGVVAFVIFLAFQLVFAFGFMIASPKGRKRAGGDHPKKKTGKKGRRRR